MMMASIGAMGQVTTTDSLAAGVDTTLTMGEVTVTGARVIHKIDRQVVLPTQTMVKNSTNGYDLLKKLMIPTIRVDEVNQAITSSQGGVQIRINDVVAEKEDILSLQPDEVVRVVFINNPGLRYHEDGLAAVINYVVKRRYAGYVGGVSTMQALTTGFNNTNAYFKYNHKKSEFTLGYRFSYRDYDHQRSTDLSTYLQPDGVERHINYIGYDNTMAYNDHSLRLGYNLAEPDKYTLNIRFDFGWLNRPYYGGIQRVEESGKADLLQYNRNSSFNNKPSLDIYYSLNMPHNQTLALNAVGTYINTDYSHRQRVYLFDQSLEKTIEGDILNDYSYKSKGKKYSLITEAIYTKNLNNGIGVSGGVNYAVSRTDNKYWGAINNVNTLLNSNNLYGFAEMQGKLGWLNYKLGIGANYISIVQQEVGFHKWTFRPELSVSTNAVKNMSFRFVSRVRPVVPSLSSLNEIRQQSSALQANDGNAGLEPYNNYSQLLSVSWDISLLSFVTQGAYQHSPKVIMTSIIAQQQPDGSYLYIWRPENQKKYDHLQWYASLTIHAIKDVLDIQGETVYTSYKTRGNSYAHNFDNWQYYLSMDLTLGKWNANYAFGNARKSLWGETINGGENISNLTVAYKANNFKVGLGCLLLGYAQGFKYTRETNSQYYKSAGYTTIKDNGNMVYVTFSYNFSRGRKYNSGQRLLENSDNESGVR